MQKIMGFFLILTTLDSIAQNPYASLKYDSLVIYDFDWMGHGAKYRTIIDEEGRLPPTVRRSVALSQKEAIELSSKIGQKESYGQITAACFDPHFGMVYYADGEVTEYITICMACNFPRPSLEIPARDQGPEEDDGEIYYHNTGFSKSFRKYLSRLKKRHGFSHWKLDSQMFDK